MRRQRQKRTKASGREHASACWCCGTARNQNVLRIFGTDRPLCSDCSRLPEIEIEVEGRSRELFSYATWDGFVPNKHRRKVDLLSRHTILEISLLARELLAEDDFLRQISAARRDREWEQLRQLNHQYELWLDMRTDRLGSEISERFD